MKTTISLRNVLLAFATMFFAQAAFGSAKTLIELEGGKPKAGLAKSWKKVKDGEYEFDLDTTQEIKAGTAVSPENVKSSLEAKLSGVKVSSKGAAKVSVTYSGAEDKFLEDVSKTRIRAEKVEIALESSTSEGGIRAKTPDREPNDGEVKLVVQKVKDGVITAKVNASKSAKVKSSSTIKVKHAEAAKIKKKNDLMFFVPDSEKDGMWVPKAGSVK